MSDVAADYGLDLATIQLVLDVRRLPLNLSPGMHAQRPLRLYPIVKLSTVNARQTDECTTVLHRLTPERDRTSDSAFTGGDACLILGPF